MADSEKSAGLNVFTARTPILGQKLYVVVIATVVVVVGIFVLVFVFLRRRNSQRRWIAARHGSGLLPLVCKEIGEIKELDHGQATKVVNDKNKNVFLMAKGVEIESGSKKGSSVSNESSTTRSESSSALSASTDGVGNFGWGRWYSLRELEIATNQFSGENVIGEGGYGIVYRGVLHDGSVVAVKNLLNNK